MTDEETEAPKRRVAISLPKLWAKVDYKPHAMQQLFHNAAKDSRFRVVSAGRRGGKSNMGGHELTKAAFIAFTQRSQLDPHTKRHEYWIVGPEYSDAEKEFRVVYNDLKKLEMPFDRPGTYYDSNGGNMHISLFGGRFLVHAKSAKYPDTLVGEGLMGVELVEAAKLKEIVWSKYIRPTLADYRGWATMTSTPEGKNWFYREFTRGQDPTDDEVWSLRAPSWTNNVLYPGGRYDPEIVSMERGMSTEKFNQEIGADFTEFVGRVFKDFTEETAVGDWPYDPNLPIYLGQDTGFTNPHVVLFIQVTAFNEIRIIGEYYQRNRTPPEVASDIMDDPKLGPLVRKASVLYPDPEDPAAAKTLADAWRVRIGGGTGGPLRDRIDMIRRWLRPQPLELPDGHPDKIPHLQVDRSCTNTIREMLDYRYPETRDESRDQPTENPMKKDDHAPEALGRFFAGHLKQQHQAGQKSRVSQARFSRGR